MPTDPVSGSVTRLELARSLPSPHAEARILEQLGRTGEALAIFQRPGAQKDIDRIENTLAVLDQ